MDTQNSASAAEIPNLKLAKVGKEREKKRSGAAYFGSGGAGSGFSGALGGAGGAGMGAGLLNAKALLMWAVVAMMSAGAWVLGTASNSVADEKPGAPKLFADAGPSKYSDLSGIIKTDNAMPNSMGYVSGSLDGMTPEERAKKKAEEDAARKAEEEAAKKAEAEANKQPETPASAGADPATIATTDNGAKLKAGKFGSLSTGMGGGLAGGGGMSGGINRNFGQNAGLGAKMVKPQNGNMTAFRKPTAASMSRAGAPMNKGKSRGFAMGQLKNAFTQSRSANSAGKAENASAGAGAAFDNNSGQGNVIDGPGVGAGVTTGGAGTTTGNPIGGGGTGTAACGAGQYADSSGNCQQTGGTKSKNAAKYQYLIDIAKGLMMLVAVLAAIALMMRNVPVYGPMIEKAIGGVVMAIGGIEMALGAAIFSMSGDKMMGGITTAVGAFTLASGFMAGKLTGVSATVTAAAGALISNALGALASQAAAQPKAATMQ